MAAAAAADVGCTPAEANKLLAVDNDRPEGAVELRELDLVELPAPPAFDLLDEEEVVVVDVRLDMAEVPMPPRPFIRPDCASDANGDPDKPPGKPPRPG